ncbi:hypothetical protein FRB94_000662 [Tulasnella sp. JGI-2019a]|nr:hypothetical protein FRB93_011922 [Tulasnella sp. JGI-2019a]KAG9006424.1 hypothetical protein FRB94_000662 [Tulasnella sp. JGI-2019a]KAG9032008.1 hypothetical protein FRB95_002030 [Tulasnella sp. JGI-2019a]
MPAPRYTVALNNLLQAGRIAYERTFVPEGPPHSERWICTVIVTAVANACNELTPVSPYLMFTGAGGSKPDAFDVASYSTLIGLGYRT